MDNEQWKKSGKCSICRRQPYCDHICKAHKELVNRCIENELANIIHEHNHGQIIRGRN